VKEVIIPRENADWRTVHGGLLALLFVPAALLPPLARWPLYLLVPVLVYAALVLVIPSLRRSVHWLKLGRWDRTATLAIVGIVLVSSAALVLYQALVRPDLAALADQLPAGSLGGLIAFGALFAVLNAVLEEVIFRGVLYDALEAQYGPATAIVVTGLAFGVAHFQGYPPGPVGAVLAAVYGLMLGLLRWRTGGLAAPTVAHVFADATIFLIVAQL
jgi:membrane protease YdiL (CAAX protease family)